MCAVRSASSSASFACASFSHWTSLVSRSFKVPSSRLDYGITIYPTRRSLHTCNGDSLRLAISLAAVKTTVLLFTRDLRLHDAAAQRAASRQAVRVVPAFVIDRRLVVDREGGPNRLA